MIYDRYDPPKTVWATDRITTYSFPGPLPRKKKTRLDEAKTVGRTTTYVFDPQYRRIVAVIEEGVRRELRAEEPGDKTP